MTRKLIVVLAAAVLLGALAYARAPFVQAPTAKRPVRVLFVGDLMLDRNVAQAAMASGTEALFAGAEPILQATDLRVANLEGTVTQNPSIAQRDHSILRFTFDPGIAAQALKLLRLSAVSLANNHAYDFGADGYAETRQRVEGDGVAVFGHPYNAPGSLSTVLDAGGMSVCLVGYHALFDASTIDVLAEIARLRPSCDRLVVFAHWGVEYAAQESEAQQSAAHAFVDAGADVVVGAHPHVVEPVEIYKGAPIFYSLGNFMFDQDFSWETEHGLALVVDFYAARTDIELVPMVIAGERASVAEGADKARVLGAARAPERLSLPYGPVARDSRP